MLLNALVSSQPEVNAISSWSIDPALIVSFAAVLFAALSPFISALVNGHTRIKEKKLDADIKAQRHHLAFYEEHRAAIIEKYIRAAGAKIASDGNEIEIDYVSAMGEVLLYLDTSLWYLVEKLDKEIDTDLEAAKETFIILCKQLSDDGVRK